MMQTISTITTTIGSLESAKLLAFQLVEARLAACVQLDGPIQSVYRWQDRVCDETEFRLTCKTLPNRREAAVAFLKAHHGYEVPQVVVIDLLATPDYAAWVASQVSELSE